MEPHGNHVISLTFFQVQWDSFYHYCMKATVINSPVRHTELGQNPRVISVETRTWSWPKIRMW